MNDVEFASGCCESTEQWTGESKKKNVHKQKSYFCQNFSKGEYTKLANGGCRKVSERECCEFVKICDGRYSEN